MKKYEVINEILLEMDQEGPHWQALGDTVRQLEADRRWRVRRAGIVPIDDSSMTSVDAAEQIRALGHQVELLSPPWWPKDVDSKTVGVTRIPCHHWGRQYLTKRELLGLLTLLRAKGSETAVPPEPVEEEAELLIVPLDQIVPNPYQPRQDFNPEQLQALADSIAANGILQFPIVERVNGGYQLIDGERRWRAAALAGRDSIPVICRPNLAEQERLLLAVESNEQRANLNPVELARALQALADDGLSNAQIGQRLGGLAASTIANKRRILELPQKILDHVSAGTLTERQAMAMLPLYLLPPAVLERANKYWQSPKQILEHATSGASSVQIRDMVKRLIIGISAPVQPHLMEIDGDGVRAANCNSCPLLFEYQREGRCTDYQCRQLKVKLWSIGQIAAAVEASGIPAIQPEEDYYSFYGVADSDIDALKQQMDGCPNRRLIHSVATETFTNRIAPEGYQAICRIVCAAGAHHCTCEQQLEEPKPEQAEQEPPAWAYRLNGSGRVRVIAPTGKSLDLERPQVAAAVRVLWGDATAALLESPDRALLAEARAAILATANRYNMPGTKMIEWYEEGPDSDTWHILAMNVRELPQGIVSQALRELVQELPEEQLRAELEEA